MTFVVHVERSTAPGHGAVVDYGAFFAGYTFADEPGKRRSLLAIEVSLESMTYGFVQKYAGPARAEHHFHFAGWGFAGVELEYGLAGCFLGEIFRSFLSEEEVERDASAAAGAAPSGISFGLSDTGNVHASQRLGIFGEGAIGAYHQDVAQLVGVAGANLLDPRIISAGRGVGAHHQFNFGGNLGVHRWQRYRVKTAGRFFLESHHWSFRGSAGDQGRGAGGVQNAL